MPGFNMKEIEWSKNLWERCRKVFKLHDARITALEQGGGGGGGSVIVTDGDPTLDWGTRSTVGTVDSTSLHVTMPAKPTYTAQDVGALPSNTTYVSGVKGDAENAYRSGQVNLTPANIGAVSKSDVIGIAHGGTGASTAAAALTALGGVATGDIINNLTSTATNKPLSAAQGKTLKDLIDVIMPGGSMSFDDLYNHLSGVREGFPCVFQCNSSAGTTLIGNAGACFGIAVKMTSTRIDYAAMQSGGRIALGTIGIPSKTVTINKVLT